MLLPVKTDTLWFHELVQPHAEVRFLRGRLAFHGWKGRPLTRARFPNMLAIFWPSAAKSKRSGKMAELEYENPRNALAEAGYENEL